MKNFYLFIILAMASSAIRANAIYTAFGPSYTFSGAAIGAHLHGESATEFTAAITDNVISIDLALYTFQGIGSTARAILANDASGLPGTEIEAFDLTGITGTSAIISATSVLHPLLTAGTNYWLELYVVDATTNVLWNLSDQPLTETGHATSNSDYNVTPTVWGANRPSNPPAFDVLGTPEPSTMWLMMAPLGLGLLMVRRRSRAAKLGRCDLNPSSR